jgi:uncharacterized membrane protein HdeD (DUF308 family)
MNPNASSDERLKDFAADMRTRASDRLGDVWWTFMLRGLLAAALGLCALIWPTLSLEILLRLVGIYCLADGVAGLVGAIRSGERPSLLQAVFGIFVGLVLLVWPGASTRLLLMVFGAWALVTGISQMIAARSLDPEHRGPRTAIGVIAAVVGLVLLLWPGTGIVTISWVIALAALILAALLIFLALRLKGLKTRIDARGIG